MEVVNWTSAGKIGVDRIDNNKLFANTTVATDVHMQNVWMNGVNIGGKSTTLPDDTVIYYWGFVVD